jgi:hypothetical protein
VTTDELTRLDVAEELLGQVAAALLLGLAAAVGKEDVRPVSEKWVSRAVLSIIHAGSDRAPLHKTRSIVSFLPQKKSGGGKIVLGTHGVCI